MCFVQIFHFYAPKILSCPLKKIDANATTAYLKIVA